VILIVPQKTKTFAWTKFSPETFRKVLVYLQSVPGSDSHSVGQREVSTNSDEKWTFDTDDEFFAEYRRDSTTAAVHQIRLGASCTYYFNYHAHLYEPWSTVAIGAPARFQVEAAFEIVEEGVQTSLIARPKPEAVIPSVFIGHGHSAQWRLLEEHLRGHHGFKTEAYETYPRSGQTITDVLNAMGRQASFAVLVHTAEDELSDGDRQARANVIHETGYFQGQLGSSRALILREDGCADFSNTHGIQEIRYSAGNIRETFGEVVATLRREFPPS